MTSSMHRLLCHLGMQQLTHAPTTAWSAKSLAGIGHGVFLRDIRRLHAEGWVWREKETVPGDEVRPPKTLYYLTERGIEEGMAAVERYEMRRSWWLRLKEWRLRTVWRDG